MDTLTHIVKEVGIAKIIMEMKAGIEHSEKLCAVLDELDRRFIITSYMNTDYQTCHTKIIDTKTDIIHGYYEVEHHKYGLEIETILHGKNSYTYLK